MRLSDENIIKLTTLIVAIILFILCAMPLLGMEKKSGMSVHIEQSEYNKCVEACSFYR